MFAPLWTTDRVRDIPLAVCVLLAVNCVVFVSTRKCLPQAINAMAFLPPASIHEVMEASADVHRCTTVVTHMFIHGDWMHLLVNLWFLAIVGAALEVKLGSIRFSMVYVTCGLVAVVGHSVLHTGRPGPVLGASGAISGLLGFYVAVWPNSKIYTLLWYGLVVPLPCAIFAVIWITLQMLSFYSQLPSPDSTAYVAGWGHLTGMAAGAIIGAGWERWSLWRCRRRLHALPRRSTTSTT